MTTFILASLACFRLTRVITDDKIMDWFRSAVIRNAPKELKTKAKQGITCPFCVSFYFSVLISWYLLLFRFITLYDAGIWCFAIWGASVLLNQLFVFFSN